MSDGGIAKKLHLPEPEGHPAVKVALDRPGMQVVIAGDPEDVMTRISDWLIDDARGRAPGYLPFTEVTFGQEFYLTAHALRSITSVERCFVTAGVHHSQRVQRAAFSEMLLPRPPS